jgi:hypothetical protein
MVLVRLDLVVGIRSFAMSGFLSFDAVAGWAGDKSPAPKRGLVSCRV